MKSAMSNSSKKEEAIEETETFLECVNQRFNIKVHYYPVNTGEGYVVVCKRSDKGQVW